MVRHAAVVVLAALAGRGIARADDVVGGTEIAELPAVPATEPLVEPASPDAPAAVTPPAIPRTRDAALRAIFSHQFASSRLFAMPVADTVGPYMLTLSGDGSLLQQTGVLTSAGVIAVGFGDIAQLEYRHSEAISVTNVYAPIPAVGVQLKLPIPDRLNVPAIGLAFRLGVPRDESFGGTTVTETVTDLYAVGRLRFSFAPWLTLHGGVRASSATITVTGDPSLNSGQGASCVAPCATVQRTLYLPTGGYEIQMNATSRIVGEIALAPQFATMPGGGRPPQIGYGVLGRFGLRWSVIPSLTLDASIGYQLDSERLSDRVSLGDGLRDVVQQWDIRLGAEVFVPWGALACRAVGAFCE